MPTVWWKTGDCVPAINSGRSVRFFLAELTTTMGATDSPAESAADYGALGENCRGIVAYPGDYVRCGAEKFTLEHCRRKWSSADGGDGDELEQALI